MLEMQKCIMPVETAEELPNLVGNHCAETPFQPTYMTSVDLASLPGTPTVSPTFQDRCHAWGVIRKRLALNGLTIYVVGYNSRPVGFVHQTRQRSDGITRSAVRSVNVAAQLTSTAGLTAG